jgi:hypothetical protein
MVVTACGRGVGFIKEQALTKSVVGGAKKQSWFQCESKRLPPKNENESCVRLILLVHSLVSTPVQ